MEIATLRDIKGKYSLLDNQKLNGVHYTPNDLAKFVSEQLFNNFKNKEKKEITIFDPAFGDGELLLALATLLVEKGYSVKVFGNEIDSAAIEIAKEKFSYFLSNTEVTFFNDDFTSFESNLKFDFVIANPPYVRTQSLGEKNVSNFSQEFELEGRIDLYYVFLLKIKKYLNENSVSGFIVSNRFMTTKSGASVREGLLSNYSLKEVYDLGDTKLFSAAVLPAVLIFSLKKNSDTKTSFTTIYSSQAILENLQKVNSPIEALKKFKPGYYLIGSQVFEIKQGELKRIEDNRSVWSISNKETDSWLKCIEMNSDGIFADKGKIRVGVKTTADKIFIKSNWQELESDLIPEDEILRPLITHHFADRFRQKSGGNTKILYTHEAIDNKKAAIDLNKFPKAKQYLLQHRSVLESREYLKKAGRNWYEIWVPQEPSLWQKPKIVFRDICEKPTFWLDKTGAIVNGDCYWLSLNKNVDEEDLWIILAVANSSFIESFYDIKFNNKLYSGRRRFMTQYVEQFPYPKLNPETRRHIIELARMLFEEKNIELEKELDELIWKIFGVIPF